jgi:hypothetical protein
MPRALWWAYGGSFSYERGSPLLACTTSHVGPFALERDGNNLEVLKELYLNPRLDSGLGLLKCSEHARERTTVTGGESMVAVFVQYNLESKETHRSRTVRYRVTSLIRKRDPP